MAAHGPQHNKQAASPVILFLNRVIVLLAIFNHIEGKVVLITKGMCVQVKIARLSIPADEGGLSDNESFSTSTLCQTAMLCLGEKTAGCSANPLALLDFTTTPGSFATATLG